MSTNFVEATLGCEEKVPDGVIHRAEVTEGDINGNANYPAPPSLVTYGTAITEAKGAQTAWDNGKGSELDRVTFEAKVHTLFGLVKGMCAYVNLTTPNNEIALTSSGFPLSHDPHGLPLLEQPRNLHRFIARNLGMEKVKLNCKKPANTAEGQRVHYKFWRSLAPDFSTAVVIGEGSKTTHTDVPAVTVATTFYYWVTGVTPAGETEPSDVLKVAVVPVSMS